MAAVIYCMDNNETTDQQAAAKLGDDREPTEVVEKLSALGLIERVNGEWRVTTAGTAALESLEVVKQ